MDLNKIPPFLLKEEDPIFAFNKAIIDATYPYTIAYKPNIAFYEAYGEKAGSRWEKPLSTSTNNTLSSLPLLMPSEVI